MKKLLSILLAIMCLCLVGCNDTPPTNDNTENTPTEQEPTPPTCEHEYSLVTSTATCTQVGTEVWMCIKCKEYKNVDIITPTHKYIKNRCIVCHEVFTDLYLLPEERRDYLCNEFEKSAPYFYDFEAMQQSRIAYQQEKQKVNACADKVSSAEYYIQALLNSVIYDEEEMKTRQENLAVAQQNLENAQKALSPYKEDYTKKAEGYAWFFTLKELNDNVSASSLRIRLFSICCTYTESIGGRYDMPAVWYETIGNRIEEIIGIKVLQ